MKILFIGAFNNTWSTNYEMVSALINLKHDVYKFNYRKYEKSYKKVDKIFSFLKLFNWLPFGLHKKYYYIFRRKEILHNLLKINSKFKPDLVLMAKTNTIDYNLINNLRSKSKVIYYFMDPPSTAKKIRCDRYIAMADHSYITFSSVKNLYSKYKNKISILPQGVDISSFYKIHLPKKYDVIFFGTKDKKRERYISILRDNQISVTCFGEGWENDSIYKSELNNILNQSKIILNFSRDGVGFSVRVQQVMASGNLLLTESCTDIKKYFIDQKHLIIFENENDLIKKTLYYLSKDNLIKKKQIENNAILKIKNEYSWESIMNYILNNNVN